MIDLIDEPHDYVDELEEEKKVLEEYISNLQKKSDKWKEAWEAAEKRSGVLERNLRSLRDLQELEIGEWEEREKRIRKILEDMPKPSRKHPVTEILNEWIDGYTTWHKRMMEHLADE